MPKMADLLPGYMLGCHQWQLRRVSENQSPPFLDGRPRLAWQHLKHTNNISTATGINDGKELKPVLRNQLMM